MSNFFLRDPDCVLIHIPKTGGTSIRKGVWKKNYEGPVFGDIPQAWRGHFKFAFVRHPFDRLVSAWKMFTDGAVGDPEWRLPADARRLDLPRFVDIVLDETIIYDERRFAFEERIRHHTIPQTHPFNCLHMADFVGRYETLERDFQHVLDRLGLKASLPHLHRTSHGGWRDYLDGETLGRCRDYYRRDFEELGYAE
jgi:hypothetical protein